MSNREGPGIMAQLVVRVAGVASVWALVGLLLVSNSSRADTADVERFTRLPAYQSVQISPSGELLAAVVRREDFEGIAILQRDGLKPVVAQHYGDNLEVAGLVWANDEVLLISPGMRLPGRTDYVFPTGEILALNVKTKRSELLYGYRAGEQQTGSHLKKKETSYGSATVVHPLPDSSKYVLVQTRPYGARDSVTELQRLDIKRGHLRSLAKASDTRSRFVVNSKGDVALRVRLDVNNELHVEEKVKNDYRTVFSTALEDGVVEPWYAAPGGGFYAFDNRGLSTQAVVLLQPDGSTTRLYHKPGMQPEEFLVNRTQDVWGVRFASVYPEYFYPDPKHPAALMHQRMRKTFPDDDVAFTSFTDDGRYVTALVHGDRNPGRFYLVDLQKGALIELLDTRPWLAPEQLHPMRPVEITTRDGQKIVAMLTLPGDNTASADGGQRPAGVVLVHGGPHGVHDRWGFDAEAQLLAAQGYAVLQVNYRGSGGYGYQFEWAGYGEWGGLMQRDVSDATQWLIQSGTADAERICIMGGSYGAYSALTGAFQAPELYRCAIGYSGAYDLPMMFEKGDIQLRSSGVNYLKSTLGENQQELQRRSPTYNADKITAKVLLAHGGLDIRTPPAHAKKMRKQLIAAGNEPQWLYFDKEAHGFRSPENSAKFYSEVVDFLGTHLKADATANRAP